MELSTCQSFDNFDRLSRIGPSEAFSSQQEGFAVKFSALACGSVALLI